jgi:hypothetical protein
MYGTDGLLKHHENIQGNHICEPILVHGVIFLSSRLGFVHQFFIHDIENVKL